jgi:hypothetical protein
MTALEQCQIPQELGGIFSQCSLLKIRDLVIIIRPGELSGHDQSLNDSVNLCNHIVNVKWHW